MCDNNNNKKRAIIWNEKLHVIIFLLLVALLALAFIVWPINSTTREIKGQISNSMAFGFFYSYYYIHWYWVLFEYYFAISFLFFAIFPCHALLRKIFFFGRALSKDIVNKITTITTTEKYTLYCFLLNGKLFLWIGLFLSTLFYGTMLLSLTMGFSIVERYSFVLLYIFVTYLMKWQSYVFIFWWPP